MQMVKINIKELAESLGVKRTTVYGFIHLRHDPVVVKGICELTVEEYEAVIEFYKNKKPEENKSNIIRLTVEMSVLKFNEKNGQLHCVRLVKGKKKTYYEWMRYSKNQYKGGLKEEIYGRIYIEDLNLKKTWMGPNGNFLIKLDDDGTMTPYSIINQCS